MKAMAIASAGAPRRPDLGLLTGLSGAALLLFFISLLYGPAGFGIPADSAWLILSEIRLPRALLAALVGAALATAGAALQGYLRNPLAEPGVIGISSGAGLGAVIAIHTGASSVLAMALPIGGLAGAALATILVLLLAGQQGNSLTLILSGVAVASASTALMSLALSLAPNPFAAVEIVFWLLGSLADRSLEHVWIAAPLIIAGLAILLRLGTALDALSLGEDGARNLGIELGLLRLAIVAGAALAVGAATAVAGTIGFVGLVVPHIIRPFVGHLPSRLLPASMLGGAILVLAADLLVRIITPAGELRLGVLTALIGTPLFLWLVVDTRRSLVP